MSRAVVVRLAIAVLVAAVPLTGCDNGAAPKQHALHASVLFEITDPSVPASVSADLAVQLLTQL